MLKHNVALPPYYTQVCVWPGLIVPESEAEKFELDVYIQMNVRIKFLETIKTNPDMDNGEPVPETGGRSDVFFAVHEDDIMKFAAARLPYGIHWIEDMLSKVNYTQELYPKRVFKYRSWDAD